MPLFCTCPQGHRWELAALPPEGEAAVRCPECGQPAAASSSGEPAAPVAPFDPASLSLDPIEHGVTVVEEPPPRAPVPAAEARAPERPLPVARRATVEPRRPAPRTSSGGLVVAVILLGVFALLLLIGGIGLFLWYQGAVAREREMAARNADMARMEAERARQAQMERARLEQQQRQQADAARNLAEVRARQLEQQQQEARRREEGLKATLYAQGIALADLELREGNMPAVLTHLRDCPVEARGWEWRYLDRLSRSDYALSTPHGGSTVLRAVFSPDGQRLLSGGTDRNGRVSDPVTGKSLLTLTGHTAPVRAVAYRPDGKVLATGGKRVIVRDATNGQPLVTLAGHPGSTPDVAFSPDGKRLASVGSDRLVRIWDPESGKEVQTLKGHTASLYAVAYSPDGSLLASAGGGAAGDSVRGEVKVWDMRTGQELLTLLEQGGAVLALAFHPDGKRLATAAFERGVKVWDVTARDGKPEPLHSFPATGRGAGNVAFSPDGKLLATGGPGGPIALRDADSGRVVRTLMGPLTSVVSLAFSPDSKRLVVCRSATPTVVVHDLGERHRARRLEGESAAPWGLAFSPEGRRLAGPGKDNSVLIWDVLAGKQVQTLRGHTRPLRLLAFPTTRWVVSVAADPKQPEEAAEVKVWDAESGKQLHTLKGHPGGVSSVVFYRPGNRLILCSPGRQPLVYDGLTGQQANLIDLFGPDWQNLDVACLAISPDEGRVATSSRQPGRDGWITIRERFTKRVLREMRRHATAIGGLAFGSDGKSLVASHVDGKFVLWETDTGREAMDLGGSALFPHSRAFSPDGRRGVWFAAGETVQLWDTQPRPNRHLLTLRGHQGQVASVTFSPDGQLIAAAGRDGTVLVWDGRLWAGRP